MAVKTVAEYKESLRDGREVYLAGQRVNDVTVHPGLREAVEHIATDFRLAHDPQFRDLLTYRDETTGELYSIFYKLPTTSEDLLRRREAIELCTRKAGGVLTGPLSTDALFALMTIKDQVAKSNAQFASNIQNYFEYCRKNHILVAIAMSDVKGDRSRPPYEQDDPDYYLRVIRERDDGIVVRGAKAHITGAAVFHEMVVLPTKAMSEREKPYSVAFAIPMTTKGVKVINRRASQHHSTFDYPISSKHLHLEALVIFDDVFVPWERVFINGEYHLAGPIAYALGTWERFAAMAYKAPLAELLVGAAQLCAEYSGLANITQIQEKIFELIMFLQSMRAYSLAAALACEKLDSGMVIPNTSITNIGKYQLANSLHDCLKTLQDIAGALVATVPSEADFLNPETRPYLEKYMATRKDVSGENRMKLYSLIHELTASEFSGHEQITTLHGEGSLAAQRIATYRSFNFEPCKQFVMEVANIQPKAAETSKGGSAGIEKKATSS